MTPIHYGSPSSLPSDYALLSRYAATDDTNDSDDMTDDDHPHARPIRRRTSCPFPHLQPLQPELLSSKVARPDEYTPLLVPRIEEEDAASNDLDDPPATSKVYRDEMRILFKYTLPVFGYASHLHVVLAFG